MNFLYTVPVYRIEDTEGMAYEWGDYDEVLEGIARAREERENKKNLRRGITELCKYGMCVGFTSIEFYSACLEAFVNADKSTILFLQVRGIKTVDEFVMFVRGCGFILEY